MKKEEERVFLVIVSVLLTVLASTLHSPLSCDKRECLGALGADYATCVCQAHSFVVGPQMAASHLSSPVNIPCVISAPQGPRPIELG